jgi:hypothetical protein
MNTETNTNVQVKPVDNCNRCKIVNMGVKRDNDGLKISLQSPINFKILQKKERFNLGGIVCFAPRQQNVDGLDSVFSTEQSYQVDGLPNLTMLLAENLKSGVTFQFPPMPISDTKIKEWMEQFKKDAKVLFLTYVKPVDYSVIITSQTIECERHD